MYRLGEGTKGVNIAAVFNGKEDMMSFIKKNPLSTKGKYILLEVSTAEETSKDVLARLGMNGTFNGADYVHDAIEMAISNDECLELITKITYPEIAKKYSVTSVRVERAIRTVIESTWDKGDIEYRKMIFGEAGKEGSPRPTNLSYIKAIAQYLK